MDCKKRIPEILVILFCMVLLGIGVSQKEGFHMDELLSFELANAEFNPWIVPTQPEGRLAKFVRKEIKGASFSETVQNLADTVTDVLQNRRESKLLSYQADVYEEPVWITAEQFHDYITVDGDAFNYLSVYFNVKDDNHPPFYFMLLHTVSSLFQGRVAAWMGCSINMICVAVCMALLMGLGRMLAPVFGMEEKGRLLGLLAALLYGCSTGAMATTLLIRMYGVVTAFCVALLYLHVKKYLAGTFEKGNKALIAVTVLGFLTQYFFLFYCLILAAVTAVLLWVQKRRRELWRYIKSMALAAVIGVGLFPFAVSDVFSSGRGVEALDNLTSGLAGFGTRLESFAVILAGRTFGSLLWMLLAVLAAVLVVWLLASRRKSAGEQVQRQQSTRRGITAMLVLPVAGYFLLAAKMSPYLVDRYIMPLFPFVILQGALLVLGAAKMTEQWKMGRKAAYVFCTIAVLAQLWGLVQYDGSYLYRGYSRQEQLSEEYASYPCICIYDGVGYYENLLEFTHYERTLLLTATELEERADAESVSALEGAVVLIKPNVNAGQVSSVLAEKYGLEPEETLYEESGGDSIILFVKRQD